MPRFSECCRQGENGEMPVDMVICQICSRDVCSMCQYGDRIDMTNITGFKGKGNVCKACLRKVRMPAVVVGNVQYRGHIEDFESEMVNQGIQNEPEPICCPECQGELHTSQGMVGERVLYCPVHGMCWEDQEDAIRRVI